MADVTVQKGSIDGITPTFSAADVAGDSFTNYGYTVFKVNNADTAAKTITLASNPCNFGENHDVTVNVPAGEEVEIGSFDTKRFNDDNRKVNISYDDVTSVTVAAIKY